MRALRELSFTLLRLPSVARAQGATASGLPWLLSEQDVGGRFDSRTAENRILALMELGLGTSAPPASAPATASPATPFSNLP